MLTTMTFFRLSYHSKEIMSLTINNCLSCNLNVILHKNYCHILTFENCFGMSIYIDFMFKLIQQSN